MVINQEYIAVYYVYNIHTYYVCTCMSKGKVTFLCKIIFYEMSTFNHLPFHCDVKKVNQIWYLANATCIYHYTCWIPNFVASLYVKWWNEYQLKVSV